MENTIKNVHIQEKLSCWLTNYELVKLHHAQHHSGICLRVVKDRQRWRPCLFCQNYSFVIRSYESEGTDWYRDVQEKLSVVGCEWIFEYYGITSSSWYHCVYIITTKKCICSTRGQLPGEFFTSRFGDVNLEMPYSPEYSPYIIQGSLGAFRYRRDSRELIRETPPGNPKLLGNYKEKTVDDSDEDIF